VSALKYATIIQIYDTIYKGEALKKMNKLEPKYLLIGIYLAELFMNHIEKHIENLSKNHNSMTSKKMISIDDLADKLINFLTKEDHIGKYYNKSELTNNSRGITADNFYDAFDLACKKDNRLRVYVHRQGKKDIEKYYAEKPQIVNNSGNYWDEF
jgi:hypothetical protein